MSRQPVAGCTLRFCFLFALLWRCLARKKGPNVPGLDFLQQGLLVSGWSNFHSRQNRASVLQPLDKSSSVYKMPFVFLIYLQSVSRALFHLNLCFNCVHCSTHPSMRDYSFSSPNLWLVHGTTSFVFVFSFVNGVSFKIFWKFIAHFSLVLSVLYFKTFSADLKVICGIYLKDRRQFFKFYVLLYPNLNVFCF